MSDSTSTPLDRAIGMLGRATELLRQASEESLRGALDVLNQTVNELEQVLLSPLSEADYARLPVLVNELARSRALARQGLQLTTARNEDLFGHRAEFYPGRR